MPPRNCGGIQIGRHVKQESVSPARNKGIQIGRRVKEELASPPPHSRYARIDGPASPPRSNWHGQFVKEELPPAISKARGWILHYLGSGGGGGPSSSWAVMSAVERAAT